MSSLWTQMTSSTPLKEGSNCQVAESGSAVRPEGLLVTH